MHKYILSGWFILTVDYNDYGNTWKCEAFVAS